MKITETIQTGVSSIVKFGAGVCIGAATHRTIQTAGELLAKIGCIANENMKDSGPDFCSLNFDYLLGRTGIVNPIIEEIAFRGFSQGLLLNYLPSLLFSKKALDQTALKAARVFLIATAFSLAHLSNETLYGDDISQCDSYTREQIPCAFLSGLMMSTLFETRLGLLGAMGAHMASNIIALYNNKRNCPL